MTAASGPPSGGQTTTVNAGERGAQNVRLLAGVLAVVAGVIAVNWLPRPHGFGVVDLLIALAVVIGFYLADAYPLHMESRGGTFTLSLSELPLVLGLLFAPLDLFVISRVIGGALALSIVRRQPRDKLLFNVAGQSLEAAVAAAVYTAVPGHASNHLGGQGVAVVAGMLTGSTVTLLAVVAVIRLHSGRWQGEVVRGFLRTSALTLLPNGCAGLIIGASVWESPWAWLPVGVVMAALGWAYRAHVELRQQHENLEMIYEFACSIDKAATSERRLRGLLEQTRDVLRCTHAELVLLPTDDDDSVTRRWVADDGRLRTELTGRRREDVPLTIAVETGRPFLAPRSSRDPLVRRFLDNRGWRDSVLVPLTVDERMLAVLIVANRTSDVATFTDEDARLLTTVAAQVATALENGQLLDRLTHDSSHDALTGLANRTTYQERLQAALANEALAPLTVLLMDLDRFKEVNDTLGHHYGDLLIRQIADRLRDATPADATVARLGGDEFAILFPSTNAVRARRVAENLWSAVAQPCLLDGISLEVQASIGIAVAPDHGTERGVLLKRADMAMYAAKRAHTRLEFYDPQRDEYSPRRLALASQLRGAIEGGEMELHYQPQLDLGTGQIVAVEALTRWRHPEYGLVPPSEFIDIAEQSGAIVLLSEWALDQAVRQVDAWRRQGLNLQVSVNLSMRNLLDNALADRLAYLLETYGLDRAAVAIEVTESQVMTDTGRTLAVLNRLSGMGLRLSIDDFGTGYSSLAYLKQLPVKEIKVDRSFVRSLAVDSQDVAIVRAIIELARSLDMEVVAEGVEDFTTLQRLCALGCHRLQGFLISRALPPQQLQQWLAAHAAEWQDQVERARARRLTALPSLGAAHDVETQAIG